MHSYLRSIGFSDIKNRRQLTPITKEIIAYPTTRNIITVDADTRLVQLTKDFGEGFGISLVGEMDIDNTVSFEYYFPYVRSSSVMNQERIYIEKHGDKESFAGVCEDYNLGMTLIFFLTNVSDYANTKWMNYSNHLINKAYMSGLSTNGKVILDIEQLPPSTKEHNHSSANRNKLIEAARQGDRTAMESLTLDDMDIYTQVNRRSHYEDILSIVETNFMPYGIETEHYSIIGNILDYTLCKNDYTNDNVYLLNVETNEMLMNIAINEKDLLGLPAPGRRFKGEIWLQGNVIF